MADEDTIELVREIDVDKYKYGFETDIESELAPKGLNEDIVRFISKKKNEPAWMLEWRLEAYQRWLNMVEPKWAKVHYPPIDFQVIHYYAAPKSAPAPKSLDEIDPKLLEILVCPLTKATLEYDAAKQELISRAAKLAYPIRDGIPIMLPEEARQLEG